ncbi:fused MFS/spermidine synthase [Patescibacteria group bacterium]|nr:fused MFS/spermidine synthase [Patescibacteria group bacterium]
MFNKSRTFLLVVAFTSGMSIMAIEISASRLLAPYFGSSLFVWTNVIGVVMVALALGYYLGGKLADRRPQLDLLLRLILAAGTIFLLVPWLVQPLAWLINLQTIASISASAVIFFGSLLVTLLLFAFPLVLLGMVSPFIIKLCSLHSQKIGNVAGSVFAWSTVGSVIGTFLPTLLLISIWGTKATITIFAIILIVLASLGMASKKRYLLGWLILLIIPVVGVIRLPIKATAGLVFEDESVYQYLQVVDEDNKRYLAFNEGGGFQSIYDRNNILTDLYYDYFTVLPYLAPTSEKKVLILGLAGGIISKQLDYFFAEDIMIDGVEIDRKVIAAADQYFALRNDSLTVHNQDGRIFLQHTDNKYDLIIVDAYQKQIYIPWTMTTQEFWQEAKAKLTNDGVVAINVNAATANSQLLQAITNSMASVFPYTYLAKVGDQDSWNYMVVASENELAWESLPSAVLSPELADIAYELSSNMERIEYDQTEMILTDDKAPIEFMIDAMIVKYYLDGQ